MLTLLIDNYDSYTFNLFQLLAEVNGEEPIVVRNDAYSWEQLAQWRFDNIVLSPGPGHPGLSRDFGVCADAIRQASVPLLGVCLGHQGLAQVHGGSVGHAPRVMHGRVSRITHTGDRLFAGIPQGFAAVRYHSLAITRVPRRLEVTAWSEDDVIMALRDRRRPNYGLQFHPESICSEHGRNLLRNFREITRESARTTPRATPDGRRQARSIIPSRRDVRRTSTMFNIRARRLGRFVDPESAFLALFADAPVAFWLDSSRAESPLSRFSFMGDASGPLSQLVEYDLESERLTVSRGDAELVLDQDVLSYVQGELRAHRCDRHDLPFDFSAGFVGYLGYELKALCGAADAHTSDWPDACLVFADRLLAFDHEEGEVYIVALTPSGDTAASNDWIQKTTARLATLEAPPALALPLDPDPEALEFHLHRGRAEYEAAIARAQQLIADGETYEVCLTNELYTTASPDPLLLHRLLRRTNPAPYSAYLRFNERAVVSSSPERYLKIDRRKVVEAKPIKGTAPRDANSLADRARARSLSESNKNRAENLMIVDLVRHDLGAVCEVGSVHVPKLMHVESYATVHQLVSTISGELRSDLDAIDCVRASFPGGSMTGAPKLRTMEIIDELEERARGVYSGTVAALGVNGTADMSIVIRTVAIDPAGARIGAGGAIVAESDPRAEFDEMLLKAQALIEAIALGCTGRRDPDAYRLEEQGQPEEPDGSTRAGLQSR